MKKIINLNKAAIFILLIAFCPIVYSDQEPYNFNILTIKRSCFQLDTQGVNKLNKSGLPYPSKSDEHVIQTSFSSQDTAFFVIDPWDNMPLDFLNKYYGEITNQYILPLIKKASQKGFPIFIFTNNCEAITPIPYSCSISKQFLDLSEKYQNVTILFWQNMNNTGDFSEDLKKMGITKIIYTGFASNMCLLFRPIGMSKMLNSGFSLYFIPKASAAVEIKQTWRNKEIHKITSIIISQGLGSLIEYQDISKAIQ